MYIKFKPNGADTSYQLSFIDHVYKYIGVVTDNQTIVNAMFVTSHGHPLLFNFLSREEPDVYNNTKIYYRSANPKHTAAAAVYIYSTSNN